MSDIIKVFEKIGEHYLDDEKRVKNKAYEYDKIKVYLVDIEDKTIEPHLNIEKDDLIICRFGVGANSGNLFPNQPFVPKEIAKDYSKFIRGIIKANKNLLSYFEVENIEKDQILSIIHSMNESFFDELKEDISKLEAYKKEKTDKGKVSTYLSLSYQGKPLSSYFKKIYEKHLNKSEKPSHYGYDMLTNEQGIGGDATLAFCSVNELPKRLQDVKPRLLPLTFESAKKVKIGFDVMDKMFSHNFYGFKLATIPSILINDETVYKKIFNVLENISKGNIDAIEKSEYYIHRYLEIVAKEEAKLPVLNTILFYNKNNAAVDVVLQIDDVLPSYISHVSDILGKYNIYTFKDKEQKSGNDETLYLQTLFADRLEIMNILLSTKKLTKDEAISKFSQLIYWGSLNKSYAYPINWSSYFKGNLFGRSVESIKRYVALFNDIDKLDKKLILQKECLLEEVVSKQAKIEELVKSSSGFLDNEVLKTAYFLGMISAALMNWQFAVSQNDVYNRWLNNSGSITKESLERIWKKVEETIRKLEMVSGHKNKTIDEIKEFILQSAPKAFISIETVKSSYVSLAFAMGGSDFDKHIKEKNKNKEEK